MPFKVDMPRFAENPKNSQCSFLGTPSARLDIFAFRQIRYNRPFGRFRYDINPRSRSEHIERVSAYRTPQVYIENLRKQIYIDALCPSERNAAIYSGLNVALIR